MTGGPGEQEGVGSVGEEAAKLFEVLQDWAGRAAPTEAAGDGTSTPGPSRGLHGIAEHVATGGEDCVYCPLCQVIHRVRQTSPEIRGHLASAASSLLKAATAFLEDQDGRTASRPTGLQRIHLDDEAPG